MGGAAYLASGEPLPPGTLALAKRADAVLFGAVGDPRFEALERRLRPEAALLGLRRELGLFANIRPATLFPGLEDASPLRPEIVDGLDIVIVRELTGDVYFGEKGQRTTAEGLREGYDLMRYDEREIERIAVIGFELAKQRKGRLCSVDKANVLETSQVWRAVVGEVAARYPEVALTHMYVDNAAMQLVRAPSAFDVIVTGNLFGDILSDQGEHVRGIDRDAALGFAVGVERGQRHVRADPRQRPRHRRLRQGPTPARRSFRRRCCCGIRWPTRIRRSASSARWATHCDRARAPRTWAAASPRAPWAMRCCGALA